MHKLIASFSFVTLLAFSACKQQTAPEHQNDAMEHRDTQEDFTVPSNKDQDTTAGIDDDALANQIKNYLTTEFLTEGDLRTIQADQRKFQFHTIDLNNNGDEEIFVNFGTTYFCGTGGCTVLLLNKNMELITKFSPVRTLFVEAITANGWRILSTQAQDSWKALTYENGTYPSNPTVVEKNAAAPKNDAIKFFDQDQPPSKIYTF